MHSVNALGADRGHAARPAPRSRQYPLQLGEKVLHENQMWRRVDGVGRAAGAEHHEPPAVRRHIVGRVLGGRDEADGWKEAVLRLHCKVRCDADSRGHHVIIGADIVEEIMRIDGLDNVDIPAMITIAPAVETLAHEATYTEKIAEYLAGSGFQEIFTNSITNSAYYSDVVLGKTVKMINNLSEELNVMRPAMMETGLTSIAYNLNRKNNDLKFFEFGKTYSVNEAGKYLEDNHLTMYITGNKSADGWKGKAEKADFYFIKAVFEKIMSVLGLKADAYTAAENPDLSNALQANIKNDKIAEIGLVNNSKLDRFDIKQPVFYADLNWDRLLNLNKKINIQHKDVSKYPAVNRDLAIIVNKALPFEAVEKATAAAKVNKLTSISLFDIFESEKIGAGKKSMAISFTFLDEEKTMTDKDIDSMMNKIIAAYEKELGAEIRK